MTTNITAQELIDFETDIGNCFNNKQIRAPIHLYSDNEDKMLKIFENVKEGDWVCGTWRSHYQCLLKGVPKDVLKERILQGKSIALCFKEQKIVCSAIVGGIPSIAAGLAWGEKLKGTDNKVWCFVGDMSAATGNWDEAHRFSLANDLPITWVIEDNGLSVLTPTYDIWGRNHPAHEYAFKENGLIGVQEFPDDKVMIYKYKNSKYPHAGAGTRVQF